MKKFNKYGANHKNPFQQRVNVPFKDVVADLKKSFEIEDNTLLKEMDFDKLGVLAVFHHSNGKDTNTLRTFGAKSDAEKFKSKIDRSDALGFLCDQARKDDLINNDGAARVLLGYAAHSQSYNTATNFYNNIGLIMNFYIEGNNYTCRDCMTMDFEKWIEMSRSLQLTGGENQFNSKVMDLNTSIFA